MKTNDKSIGKILRGNWSKLKRARETNAYKYKHNNDRFKSVARLSTVDGVRLLPVVVYTTKVTKDTKKGAEVQKKVETLPKYPALRLRASSPSRI